MYPRLTPMAMAMALAFVVPASLMQAARAQAVDAPKTESTLPAVTVNASADASAAGLPEAYAGGQVARGGRVGFLGNQDFLDTPFYSTSYTQELIKDQQARGVGDVLKNDPAVRTTRGFGNYQEAYMIRGFIANSDDLSYNGLYGILPRQYVAAELFERVEVFLGASAFLNGAAPGDGGLGGTINALPKRAGNEPLTQLTLGYESGNQKYVAADVARRFGPDDRLGVRFNGVRRGGGTAIANEKHEVNLLSVGVDYRGNNFRLSGDIGVQENNLTNPRPSVSVATTLTAVPAAPDSSRNFSQPWVYSNERDTFATLRGEWDITSTTTAWAAAGTRMSSENNSLSTPTVTNLNGASTARRFDNNRRDTVRTGETGIRTKFDTGPVQHTVSGSASTYWLDSRNAFATSTAAALSTNIYNPPVIPLPLITSTTGGDMANPKTTTKTQLWSVALADSMSFYDDMFALTVGVRRQSLKANGYSYVSPASTSRYDESTTSPMGGLVFKPLKNLSLYANYIQGLQQGKQVTDTTAANFGQILAPYKSTQREVGAKYDAGKIGFGLSYFTTSRPLSYKDTLTRIESTNGTQRNRGVELTAFGQPLKDVRLLAGVTFLQAKQEQTSASLNNGNYAIGVPKTQANLGAEWDIPGLRGLTVNGRATYTSTQYLDAANKQQVPSWTRYDLGARYTTQISGKVVTFRGSVENLTNKSYWESAGGASNSGYLVLNTPRTFVTSVSVDF